MWVGPAFRKYTRVEVVSAHSDISTESGGRIAAFVLERIMEEEQQ